MADSRTDAEREYDRLALSTRAVGEQPAAPQQLTGDALLADLKTWVAANVAADKARAAHAAGDAEAGARLTFEAFDLLLAADGVPTDALIAALEAIEARDEQQRTIGYMETLEKLGGLGGDSIPDDYEPDPAFVEALGIAHAFFSGLAER